MIDCHRYNSSMNTNLKFLPGPREPLKDPIVKCVDSITSLSLDQTSVTQLVWLANP